MELLKEKRQAVISHAVTRGLNPAAPLKPSRIEWHGDVPDHWEVIRLGNLFREVADAGRDELPILTVSIHRGVSDREETEEEMDPKVTRSEDRSKYVRVVPGDLVYIHEASDPVSWHERKGEFASESWLESLRWMKEHDLVPKGFGLHTRKFRSPRRLVDRTGAQMDLL
jgi:hypothetical protein